MTIVEKLQDEISQIQQKNGTLIWELLMSTEPKREHSNKMQIFANVNMISGIEKAMEIVCAHHGEPVESSKCPNEKH